jgi:hypothetical protein
MRVLVCGGRGFNDAAMLMTVLDYLHAIRTFTCVIEGEQRGADVMARAWAEHRGVPVIPVNAHWERGGAPMGQLGARKTAVG